MAKLDDTDDSPDAARVASTWEGGVPVISIAGEIDLASADEVRRSIESIVGGGQERVVFDVSRLEFMDSSGISLFLAIAERLPVEIRNPTPIIRQLIEMTGVAQALHLTP